MRLAIVGSILAVAFIAAPAQSAPRVEGSKAFCLKSTDKITCNFDTLAMCEKGAKDMSKDSTTAGTCVSRAEAR